MDSRDLRGTGEYLKYRKGALLQTGHDYNRKIPEARVWGRQRAVSSTVSSFCVVEWHCHGQSLYEQRTFIATKGIVKFVNPPEPANGVLKANSTLNAARYFELVLLRL